MLSEPKSKQKEVKEIHKFVVLNHLLSSYAATLIASLQYKDTQLAGPALVKTIKKALFQLSEAAGKLDSGKPILLKESDLQVNETGAGEVEDSAELKFIAEELDFVLQTCTDISKISRTITL